MKNLLPIYILSLGFSLFSSQAWANSAQLRQSAHDFVRQAFSAQAQQYSRVEIEIGQLDSRLKLTKCAAPLKHKIHNRQLQPGRILLLSQCPGSKPWKVYLPVNIKAYRPVVVVTDNISRGQSLSLADLALQEREISRYTNHSLHSLNQAVNQVAKKHLRSGSVLSSMHIGPPKVIKRGSKIDIVASSGRVSVRMAGKAMADGRVGDQIKVKNLSSNKILQAQVVSSSLVSVTL